MLFDDASYCSRKANRHESACHACRRAKPRLLTYLATTALIGCCMVAPVLADADHSTQSLALEVIVKFSDNSGPGRLVGRIIKEGPNNPSNFAELEAPLRASTGLMLTPISVTSGRELIVGIAEKPLLEQLQEFLAKSPALVGTELIELHNENPRLAKTMLLVRFPASSDEALQLRNAQAQGGNHSSIQGLATSLSAGSGVPVQGVARGHEELALTLDRYKVLEEVVQQLNDMDAVDYAQPNSTVQFMK